MAMQLHRATPRTSKWRRLIPSRQQQHQELRHCDQRFLLLPNAEQEKHHEQVDSVQVE